MWFFYAIGAWYIGFVPLLIIWAIIVMSSKQIKTYTQQDSEQRQRYSIFVAWLAILAWMIGIGQFFSDNTVGIGLWILGVNIAFWMGSYLFNYNDGKSIAQVWYYASIIYIIRQASYSAGRQELGAIISLLWCLTLGVVWFIWWVIGHRRQIESWVWYTLFILSWGAVILAIGNYIDDIYTSLLINSGLVLVIALAMYRILQYRIPTTNQTKTVSLRRILAWEKIIQNRHIPQHNRILALLHNFVADMPLWTKYVIEWANCWLVVTTIILYLSSISIATTQRHQIVYWVVIGLFISTALVLKRIGFVSIMQKVTLFAVINYAIYLTLYTVFGGSLAAIAWWAIIWNIISSILIFYGPSSFVADILEKQDYRYWIVMTVLWLFINIYLLWLTSLPWQLIFSLVFIYCGIQGLLLYYGIKHIQQLD